MNSNKKQARVAGLWYLLLGITARIGIGSELFHQGSEPLMAGGSAL